MSFSLLVLEMEPRSLGPADWEREFRAELEMEAYPESVFTSGGSRRGTKEGLLVVCPGRSAGVKELCCDWLSELSPMAKSLRRCSNSLFLPADNPCIRTSKTLSGSLLEGLARACHCLSSPFNFLFSTVRSSMTPRNSSFSVAS